MNRQRFLKVMVVVLLALAWPALNQMAEAAFSSGSTGADGAFSPTETMMVELPPDGILNYTTVNIPSGVTIWFKKNARNTPVYMLATGNVTIAGNLTVSGSHAIGIFHGKAGPGGFDGGFGGSQSAEGGSGLGPGGGTRATRYYTYGYGGGGGGFGTNGATGQSGGTGGKAYSNIKTIPFIGGSGGGGGAGSYAGTGGGGGSGGGAILIASSGTVNISGQIFADAGYGTNCNVDRCGSGGSGSGGAIKIMAEKIIGNGGIYARGGPKRTASHDGGAGGNGRIRLEANMLARTSGTTPGFTAGSPEVVFHPGLPTMTITSIGGINVAEDASGQFSSPDVVFPSNITNPVNITISATNVPLDATITIRAVPEFGIHTNTSIAGLNGTVESSSASANITLSTTSISVLTLLTTFAVQTASNGAPFYAGGEKVVKMRVSSVFGGASNVTYITESGKEFNSLM